LPRHCSPKQITDSRATVPPKRIAYRRMRRAYSRQLCDLAIARLKNAAIEIQFNSVKVMTIIGLTLLRVTSKVSLAINPSRLLR